MRSSSGLHVPPRRAKKPVVGSSQSVIGLPPANETLLSSVVVPKPIHELSGDQNASIAPSVHCRWLGWMRGKSTIQKPNAITVAEAAGRRHSWTALVALRAPAAVQQQLPGRPALPLYQPLKLLPMWLGNSVTHVLGRSGWLVVDGWDVEVGRTGLVVRLGRGRGSGRGVWVPRTCVLGYGDAALWAQDGAVVGLCGVSRGLTAGRPAGAGDGTRESGNGSVTR